MAAAKLFRRIRLEQALTCIFPDRLQQPVAAAYLRGGEPNEALLDEGLQDVEVRVADFLAGFESRAAGEDREVAKEPLLILGEQAVAPFDRGSQRLVAGVGIAPALEQVEPGREPLEDLGGGQG